ncbi:hypothetical protein [Virgisporangium aurantiacum]|uniref:Uncharacterized protein n=1 Tax=Virgisporangium aurantiacum TaxID=175570 RepID=A0A8J3Z2R4_9ACTN|nr:hypothetical protein [Virgisporangium aurantiacum]GIJ56204.1 hypothetical protein Vau01_037200 [Virgisporangium aurantiacum]
MSDDLTGLGARGFERMCQALASYALGPGIQVFGDGPDGGREASFHGRLSYPSSEGPWDGYGVLQAKYKDKATTTGHDTAWLLGRVKAEMDAWVDPNKRRVRDGRLPEYLIFATNVSLSAVPASGGKDRVDNLISSYLQRLPLKDWRIWDANQITTFLDCYPNVRRAFAALITPNELIATMHDRLTAPHQTRVTVEMPSKRIRPGQPGNEAAFQPAFDAAGGAERLGEALGEVDQTGPGLVQHFDGGPAGEPAVLCALIGHPVIAVAQSVWNDLCAAGANAPNGGVVGVGYPAAGQARLSYLGPDAETIDLVGGAWGRPSGGIRRGRLLRRPGLHPLWQPEIVFDSEASRDQDIWTNRTSKMDLRLCVATRIPLVADGLRVTESGRDRMLKALARTGVTGLVNRLAMRYGLDPTASWQETEEPEGHNDSRFAAYQMSIAGDAGRPALRSGLWLTLPDGLATEVSTVMDLRVDFDAIRPASSTAVIAADLRLGLSELIEFFSVAWHLTTMILPLSATEDPVEVPPAGAPRLELYIQNERPDASGDPRVLRTLDMIDLSAFGRTRRKQIRHLAVAATAPLGLPQSQVDTLARQAMVRIAEDFGFTGIPLTTSS